MFHLISKFVWDFSCSAFLPVEEDIAVDKCTAHLPMDLRYRRPSASPRNRSRRKPVGTSDPVEATGLLGPGQR